MNRETETQTCQKTKYMRKTVKHSTRRQKLKDAKGVRNNKETGEGERPKHTAPKLTDAEPTPQKIKLTT